MTSHPTAARARLAGRIDTRRTRTVAAAVTHRRARGECLIMAAACRRRPRAASPGRVKLKGLVPTLHLDVLPRRSRRPYRRRGRGRRSRLGRDGVRRGGGGRERRRPAVLGAAATTPPRPRRRPLGRPASSGRASGSRRGPPGRGAEQRGGAAPGSSRRRRPPYTCPLLDRDTGGLSRLRGPTDRVPRVRVPTSTRTGTRERAGRSIARPRWCGGTRLRWMALSRDAGSPVGMLIRRPAASPQGGGASRQTSSRSPQ